MIFAIVDADVDDDCTVLPPPPPPTIIRATNFGCAFTIYVYKKKMEKNTKNQKTISICIYLFIIITFEMCGAINVVNVESH